MHKPITYLPIFKQLFLKSKCISVKMQLNIQEMDKDFFDQSQQN